MTESLAVLALDAADQQLAERWDCENLLLGTHQPIETFAWSKDEPYTPEVWATVATGVMPDDHGIGEDTQDAEWDNPLLRAGSRVTKGLPPRYRQALGRPFRVLGASQHFETVNDDCSTPFDETLSWPGVDDAEHLREMWSLADEITRGDATTDDAPALFRRLTAQEFGWLAVQSNFRTGCYGVHCHTLDLAGHIFCEREEDLRYWYEWVDEGVGWLREEVDRLVLLSDHGMQVEWYDDEDPGSHSWRSFIAADGVVSPLPEHVVDVAAWLDDNSIAATGQRLVGTAEMDTPTETLADLGYIEQ